MTTETHTDPIPAVAAEAPAGAKSARPRSVWHEPQDAVPASSPTRADSGRADRALEHARLCARIAADNRGKDVLLLDLRESTPLVDYFVVVSAASRRQAYSIADEISQEMKRRSEGRLGVEGAEEARWILIDYGDFVVHVFSDEARQYYALEEVWGDAPKLDWQDPARASLASP